MHVLDALKEWKSDREHLKGVDAAKAMFEAQVEGISQIAETRGLREIMTYWRRVQDAAHKRLVTAEGRGAEIARGEAKCAGDFLNFVENLMLAAQQKAAAERAVRDAMEAAAKAQAK